MKVNLTSKAVRGMVQQLRQNCPGLSSGAAYEAVAALFGHPNWDTFSGLLKKESALKSKVEPTLKPVDLYVETFATGDYGSSPDWARITMDADLLAKLLRMQQVCVREDLTLVCVDACPEEWHEPSEEEPLRIRDESLYVSASGFWWFRGVPKHCDYAVETRSIELSALTAAMQAPAQSAYFARRGDTLAYSSSGEAKAFLASLEEAGLIKGSETPED